MSFPYINAYQQFFDSSGAPLASGTIEFRDPTTNALINSYPTADNADAQTNANANPLTLSASGAAPTGLFLEDGVKYKVIVKDVNGATIATHDDVLCPVSRLSQTADETSAGVTVVNEQYDEGVFDRYLTNTTPGTTDMTTAINAAINVMNTKGGGMATGLPGANYLCLAVAMKSNVTLDLNGGTLTKNAGAASTHIVDFTGTESATTTTLTANADRGDTALTVTSESGFAAGNVVLLYDATYKYGTTGRNQEINRVASTAANTITLKNDIIGNYVTASTATITKLNALENAGIQNGKLAITAGDDGGNIAMELAYNCFVRGCLITGFDDDPGVKTQESSDIDIAYNTFRDGQNLSTGGFGYAVSVGESSIRVNVHHNFTENIRESVFTNNARYSSFTDNICRASQVTGVNTHGDGCEHILIANNNFQGERQYAIAVGNSSAEAFDTHISVIGNTIYGTESDGISVASTTDGLQDNSHVLIANNTINQWGITGTSRSGIAISDTNHVTIIGNRFDNGSSGSSGNGILTARTDDIVIESNVINDISNGFGITLSTDSTGVVVDGNHFYNISSHNVREAGSGHSGNVIQNNKADDDLVSFLSTPRRFNNQWGADYDTNYGAATSVADGGTITHNMQAAPTVVTATGSVASEFVSVTAIGATTFTVAIKKDDGTAGTSQTIYWRAQI